MCDPTTIIIIASIIIIILIISITINKSSCSQDGFINQQHKFIEKFEKFEKLYEKSKAGMENNQTHKPLYLFEMDSNPTDAVETYVSAKKNTDGLLDPSHYYETYNNLMKNTQIMENNQSEIKSRRWAGVELKNLTKELFASHDKKSVHNIIDHVLYINLPSRLDRKTSTEAELAKLGLPYSRIDGEPNKFGGLGCSKAHLKALQYAKDKNYSSILICEDDVTFKFSANKIHRYLSSAIGSVGTNWDVILLSGGNVRSTPAGKYIKRLKSAQTRTAYLVNASYYDTLINNFTQNVHELTTRGPESYRRGFAGDQFWKRLQPVGNWYIMSPKLCRQRKSYSNIQNQVKDYGNESFTGSSIKFGRSTCPMRV